MKKGEKDKVIYKSDFLVIGSGIAGLSFALKAAEWGTVHLVTKKEKADTNTNRAQGGIASVLGMDDSFALHIQDTLRSGDGLCREEVVRLIVEDGPVRIGELLDMGVGFTQDSGLAEHLQLGREGGHSRRRIVHAGDLTGQAVEDALLGKVEDEERITVLENHIVLDLITRYTLLRHGREKWMGQDECWGAYVLDKGNDIVKVFLARAVVLCTGGSGKVYRYTTNPDVATGDGVACAYRAGAVVANMEFVQFHPTCLYHPKTKNFLITEAVRGEGGRIIDSKGQAFMKTYHEFGDLATRDIVARAIDAEMKKSGDDCVFLDITHREAGFIQERFPNIYRTCLGLGIDITRQPIPVVPASHYQCGGVLTDTEGRTSIPHLYALGEVACTGLHGANRLASNSLLEALVMADRAAVYIREDLKQRRFEVWPDVPDWDMSGTVNSDEAIVVSHNWEEIRRCMWNYVGIVRSTGRLLRALNRIRLIQGEIEDYYQNYKVTGGFIELRNITLVAELIIRSALFRKESRGLHYTLDFPDKDDEHFQRDTIFRLGVGSS